MTARVIKSYDHTCDNVLAQIRNVIEMFVSTTGFLIEIMFILKVVKSLYNGFMINRILHSWSFHMKFMKLAEGSFH